MKYTPSLLRNGLTALFLLSGARAIANEPTPAITELLESQAIAWNAGDAKAWGDAYTENSRFINILGMLFDGREANADRHAHLFRSIFEGSQLQLDVETIVFPTDDIALADTILTLTGHQRTPPGIVETQTGELITRMKYVLQKQANGSWKIIAAQNTAVSPIALPTEKD